MKCRKLVDKNIVWFKSYGVDYSTLSLMTISPSYGYYVQVESIYSQDKEIAKRSECKYWFDGNVWHYRINSEGDFTEEAIIPFGKLNAEKGFVFDLIDPYYTVGSLKAEDNYSTEEQGVIDSLTQRLSILKGELWININYGIPLLEKHKNKYIFDYTIIEIITSHPDVLSVNFNSKVENNKYYFYANIVSKYGKLVLNQTI